MGHLLQPCLQLLPVYIDPTEPRQVLRFLGGSLKKDFPRSGFPGCLGAGLFAVQVQGGAAKVKGYAAAATPASKSR